MKPVGVSLQAAGGLTKQREGVAVSEADEDEQSRRPSIDDTLEYIADMLLALEEMARRNDLRTLAGIIDLARDEARQQTKKQSKP